MKTPHQLLMKRQRRLSFLKQREGRRGEVVAGGGEVERITADFKYVRLRCRCLPLWSALPDHPAVDDWSLKFTTPTETKSIKAMQMSVQEMRSQLNDWGFRAGVHSSYLFRINTVSINNKHPLPSRHPHRIFQDANFLEIATPLTELIACDFS